MLSLCNSLPTKTATTTLIWTLHMMLSRRQQGLSSRRQSLWTLRMVCSCRRRWGSSLRALYRTFERRWTHISIGKALLTYILAMHTSAHMPGTNVNREAFSSRVIALEFDVPYDRLVPTSTS